MRKNAFVVNDDYKSYANGKGRRALASYLKYGYIPLEDSVKESFHKNEQVSRTMEYAYDDYALAQVAKKLGHINDYNALMKRSANYKNVFDSSAGFARGRYADGKWIEAFDPYKRASYITEGTPFQYTFSAPQDIKGLMTLMGGKQAFVGKLDTFFDKGYYWHGNEHGQHIPYLYVYAGEAWKTQQLIRKIINEEYNAGPGGISGNEDAGQMSAWLVFSMMGFYPVCPGSTEYVIGSPVFDEIKIALANKKNFTVKAINNSPVNKYIQKAILNGKELKSLFLQHATIVGGGELLLYMADKPMKE
jgi:predicted alpha-1,2-mannosidase